LWDIGVIHTLTNNMFMLFNIEKIRMYTSKCKLHKLKKWLVCLKSKCCIDELRICKVHHILNMGIVIIFLLIIYFVNHCETTLKWPFFWNSHVTIPNYKVVNLTTLRIQNLHILHLNWKLSREFFNDISSSSIGVDLNLFA
jgi:hypothetical protein